MSIFSNKERIGNEEKYNKKRNNIIIVSLAIILFLIFLLSFTFGRYGINVKDVLKTLAYHYNKENINITLDKIIFNIRLPRIIMAILIGAALSASGAVYQGIFQNPMASPDILGATNGACFGAALAILLNLSSKQISLFAFLFSIIAVLIVYFIGNRASGRRVINLVLSGIMIGSIFTSLTSFVKLVCDPMNQLPTITYWLMGSLQGTTNDTVYKSFIPIFLSLVILYIIRWHLNLLAVGDEEAHSLGVNVNLIRLISIIAATFLTATAVSAAGMIGFVGLVIPHMSRKLVGNNYKYLMPCSIILGSNFLLIIDNISRNLLDTEIPIGILTSLIGAPFFLYLIFRKEGKECSM